MATTHCIFVTMGSLYNVVFKQLMQVGSKYSASTSPIETTSAIEYNANEQLIEAWNRARSSKNKQYVLSW